jgi:hypothetical protein
MAPHHRAQPVSKDQAIYQLTQLAARSRRLEAEVQGELHAYALAWIGLEALAFAALIGYFAWSIQ